MEMSRVAGSEVRLYRGSALTLAPVRNGLSGTTILRWQSSRCRPGEWKEIECVRSYNRQALYTSSPKCERGCSECITKCPMWNGKQVVLVYVYDAITHFIHSVCWVFSCCLVIHVYIAHSVCSYILHGCFPTLLPLLGWSCSFIRWRAQEG